MSTTDLLESLQRRLQSANAPTVARHTVAGIFATLRKAGISADSRASAISSCLSRPHKIIVQEAAEQLLSLTLSGALPPVEAVDFLLNALTTAGPTAAAPLADALCRLLVAACADPRVGVAGGGAPPGPPALRPGRWTSHPLVSALLSCPGAATQLLSSAPGALAAAAAAFAAAAATGTGAGAPAAAAGGTGAGGGSAAGAAGAVSSLDGTWDVLEPFFSFVLLQRHPAGATERAQPSAVGPAPALTSTPASASTSATSLATCALAAWLHGQLVRLACGGGGDGGGDGGGAAAPLALPPALRVRVLTFLTAHLALGPRGAEVDRMRAVQSTTDLLDVLEAVLYDVEEHGNSADDAAAVAAAAAAAGRAADALLQLAFEVMLGSGAGGGGGGGGGQEVVAALLRLQALVPSALAGRLAALALLTLSAYGKELQGLHLLLHKALQQPAMPPQSARPAAVAVADAALSLQPLLAAVAYGTAAPGSAAAAWPAHLAAALQCVMAAAAGDGGGGTGTAVPSQSYGDLCLQSQCRLLLLSLWSATAPASPDGAGVDAVVQPAPAPPAPCDLLRWLRSLELALRQRRRAAAAAKAASEQLPFATKIADVVSEAALGGGTDAHPAVTCLVAALLVHPDPRVRAAAAAAARQLIQLLPSAALPLLPLVMYQLQRGGGGGDGDNSGGASASGGAGRALQPGRPSPSLVAAAAEGAAAQLALLQLLPVMASDPAVAPYALRVLQPMLQPESPEVLRCLALKLLCDTWLISGRGWPQVESALNGLSPPGARDPPASLRVTRAALVRAVCDRDPGRGIELVSALQQCIRDASLPAAAALALEALGVLVEEDVLDFYTAYRVVHRWHPGLPSDPLVGSRWVALLAHGSLDAEAHPDKAAAVINILWSTTRHPEGQVRAAAYSALSRYPPDVLERLEVLRPLCQYTAPLLVETDPRVAAAARELAAVALRFEHANRRRLLLTQPAADSTQPPGPTDASGGGSPAHAAEAAAATTTATAAGSGGGGSSKGAAFAAAATAREARALRNRLLGRIPKTLLAGSGSGSGRLVGGGGGGGAGAFHPGAMLFCYSRPPPPALPPGASAAAAAAAAKRAAAEAREAYCQRLRDGLRRLGWRGPWHARLAVQAWAAFLRRWMDETGLAAAEAAAALAAEWDGAAAGPAAAVGGAGGGGAAAAAPAGSAPAAVLEGAGVAAGALCLAAEGLSEADVSGLVARLMQQAQAGRSSGITRSSLVGAALAATRLHPTDWAARQQVLSELRVQLMAGPTAVVRSAAAAALGVLAGSLAADPAIYIRTGGGQDGGGDCSRELSAVAEALSCLASNLGALCPQLAPAVSELGETGLPAGWPSPEASYGAAPRPLADEVDEQEVLPGTAVALASLLCDVNRAHGLPAGALSGLTAALVGVAAASSAASAADGSGGGGGGARRRACGSGNAAAVAALEAVAVLAPEALRYQQLSVTELSYTLTTLRGLYGGGGTDGSGAAAGVDGRVRGAAAYCLGCVAVAALRQGLLTLEVVSELNLSPPPAPPAPPQSSDAAAATAMLALVSELTELATGGAVGAVANPTPAGAAAVVAGAKGQHTAAARTGAVAALAAVLLPPPPSLVDALAPIPPGAISAGLLAQPEYLAPAKASVRALEGLAAEDSDPWVASAAAFHLAAVSAAVAAAEGADDSPGAAGAGGGGGEGTAAGGGTGSGGARGAGAAGGPKALSLYPPEGAVRPLVSALMDRSRLAALPQPALADTLIALAAAPALPAADWPTACRTLLAAAAAANSSGAGAAAALRLHAAALLLALSHGSVPSLGLGGVLEEMVAPARFAALPPAVQALLLARLPALLRSLAAKRAAAVVQALPGLLAAARTAATAAYDDADGVGSDGDGDVFPWSSTAGLDDSALLLPWVRRVRQSLGAHGDGDGGALLTAHCWVGLLGVCRAWQAKDAALTHRDITQATHTAIATLAAQLPPLPPLQPGEAAQLLAWAAGSQTSGAAAAVVPSAGGGAAGDEWDTYGPCGRPLATTDAEADVAAAAADALRPLRVAADAGGGGGGADAPRARVTLWALATCCLRCLRPDFLTAQVLAPLESSVTAGAGAAGPAAAVAAAGALGPQAVATLQLRCVLVAAGHVSYRELMPVRAAAAPAGEPAPAAASAASAGDDPLLVPLSLALAGTPQAFQVQVLLQTLDGARISPHPTTSLELAATLVAACLGYATSGAAAAAPELCVALTSRRTALQCLPYTLPRLLSRHPWSTSCEAVAQAMLAVAREWLRREGAGAAASEAGCRTVVRSGVAGCVAEEPLVVVLACLWALRDSLSSYTYDQLHAALGWRVLARVSS